MNSPSLVLRMLTSVFKLATVQKIVSEILTPASGVTFAKDARDLLIDCCVEFITLISSEANDIAEKEAKKTIAAEHVEKALRELGFPEYVQEVLAVAGEHKEQLRVGLRWVQMCMPTDILPRQERRSRARWSRVGCLKKNCYDSSRSFSDRRQTNTTLGPDEYMRESTKTTSRASRDLGVWFLC